VKWTAIIDVFANDQPWDLALKLDLAFSNFQLYSPAYIEVGSNMFFIKPIKFDCTLAKIDKRKEAGSYLYHRQRRWNKESLLFGDDHFSTPQGAAQERVQRQLRYLRLASRLNIIKILLRLEHGKTMQKWSTRSLEVLWWWLVDLTVDVTKKRLKEAAVTAATMVAATVT
jgi:hypothetical protein